MKPERAFVAERSLAQHCSELFRPEEAPADLTPALAHFCEGLARVLGTTLAPLCAGAAPLVRSGPVRLATMAEIAAGIAPLAANSLLAAASPAAPLLASIEAAAVLRLMDRAFGGRGDVPSPLPSAFPLSAELMVARIEGMVGAALALALGTDPGSIEPVRRDGCIAQLGAFPRDERMAAVSLEVADAGRAPWTVLLAFPLTTLARLFDEGDRPRAARHAKGVPDPLAEPFADLPLTVCAALVDMRIGFAALSNLQPGQIIPVAVARSVPLKVGETTIAHGTIGALDDRVAVQVTQAF